MTNIDNLLDNVNRVLVLWEQVKTRYQLTPDLIAEGTRILKEEKDARIPPNSGNV